MDIAQKLAENINNRKDEIRKVELEKWQKISAEIKNIYDELESIKTILFDQVKAGEAFPSVRLTDEQEELLRKSKTFEDSIDGFKFKRYADHVDEAYRNFLFLLRRDHKVHIVPVYRHDGMGVNSWVVVKLKPYNF